MNAQQFEAFTLQYITHHNDRYTYLEGARKALEGGCRWIQLRMKDATEDEVETVGRELKPLCQKTGAVFLLDDHVELCQKLGADGVHLGKKDMPPAQARALLGSGYLIGGTCNTFADIEALKDDVDYIGCGPFRFTTTKKGLAPVLGLEGYRDLVWQCRSQGINLPMVAIGGITRADVAQVLNAGPNGIALSGAILNAEDPTRETELLLKAITESLFSNVLNRLPDCGL